MSKRKTRRPGPGERWGSTPVAEPQKIRPEGTRARLGVPPLPPAKFADCAGQLAMDFGAGPDAAGPAEAGQ